MGAGLQHATWTTGGPLRYRQPNNEATVIVPPVNARSLYFHCSARRSLYFHWWRFTVFSLLDVHCILTARRSLHFHCWTFTIFSLLDFHCILTVDCSLFSHCWTFTAFWLLDVHCTFYCWTFTVFSLLNFHCTLITERLPWPYHMLRLSCTIFIEI